MKTKHTPAPWSTTKELLSPIVNKNGIAVLSSKIPDDEVIANKQLIAAAPEMLDVLITVKSLMLKTGININNAEQYNLINNLIKKATL